MKKLIIVLSCICCFNVLFLIVLFAMDSKKEPNVQITINEIVDTVEVNVEEIEKIPDVEVYILLNSKLKLHNFEIEKIKNCVEKYTDSLEQYFTMIGLYCVESHFNPKADSYMGAKYGRGLGQVSEIALEEYNRKNNTDYKPTDLYDIETNIKISCWLISFYENHYGFTKDESIMAYNMGCGNIRKGNYNYNYLNKVINAKNNLF